MKKKTYKTSIEQGYIDEETGEEVKQTLTVEKVEGYIDVKLPQKHRIDNGNFIVLFQKSMNEIAINNKYFTRNELTIILYLLGNAGIGNSIYIDYPTFVEDLGIKRTHCVTAVNCLARKGIIIKKNSPPGMSRSKNESMIMQMSVNFDQLNYNLAYNGKFKDHKILKFDHPPIQIENENKDNEGQLSLFDQE